MDINGIVEKFRVKPKVVALGLSSLESFANDELHLNDNPQVAVPDNLIRLLVLIRNGSIEHRRFLIRIIRYFREREINTPELDEIDNSTVDRIIIAFDEFQKNDRLVVITDEINDEEIQESLNGLYPGSAFEISLSPKRNFLRDYLVRIYSWSKSTGGIILERSRRVFSDVGHHIATLQFPDKIDHYTKLKSQYLGRMFGFRGGRSTKFFVGCVISIAGLNNPIASIAGVIIAFADP